MGKLPAVEGRSTLQNRQQRFGKRQIGAGQQPVGSVQRRGHGQVELFLTRRIAILQPGEQRPAFTGGKVHPMNGIDDLAVFSHQHQIALSAHQLADQTERGTVAQLVGGLKVQGQYAVQPLLGDTGQTPAAQMLTQQQTEHGRSGRVFDGNRGKVQTRRSAC